MAKSEINLKHAFYLEPEDAVKYFESKGCKISFDWYEVYEQAHAKAFTVAKMTELDLLKDTQDMLTKAMKEGWTEKHFKKEAMALFEKKGWVGHKEVENPKTGEKQIVELGTPRRIRTIFVNNMNSAYAVGRYKKQLEDVDFAPYWQYNCILDGKTRPEHKAMHGKVFRYDDEFWQTHYPPNGWNCRCFVKSLTEREMERKGLKPESSSGHLRDVTDVVGGEERGNKAFDFDVAGKKFTLKPDAGWGTNNGIHAWNLDVQAYKKAVNLPKEVQDNFISDMAQNVHNKNAITTLTEKIILQNFKLFGLEEKPITWITPTVLKYLQETQKLKIQSPVITFEARQVKHSLGLTKVEKQKLTKTQFLKLHDILNGQYDELYYDTEMPALMYVKKLPKEEIVEGRDCIVIPVNINCKRTDRPVNYIGTTKRIIYNSAFRNSKRYKKIE